VHLPRSLVLDPCAGLRSSAAQPRPGARRAIRVIEGDLGGFSG
jgi:hypothetical protein